MTQHQGKHLYWTDRGWALGLRGKHRCVPMASRAGLANQAPGRLLAAPAALRRTSQRRS